MNPYELYQQLVGLATPNGTMTPQGQQAAELLLESRKSVHDLVREDLKALMGHPRLSRLDRERLQQILLNLLSNAVKFTPSGGSIWIEAATVKAPGSQGRVDVRVGDTGEGIPAHKLDWVFEPFTQVDASHSRVGQGAGLGLAISRDLARGMGGDLVAASEVGVGSVFTLSLRERP